jgi:hypothetical protein
MRIDIIKLIDILDEEIEKKDGPHCHRIGERHCRISFSAENRRGMLLSILNDGNNDSIRIHCEEGAVGDEDTILPIKLCLRFMKEGLDVICLSHQEKVTRVVFDSTDESFKQFVTTLQEIALRHSWNIFLGSEPLGRFRNKTIIIKMEDGLEKPMLLVFFVSCDTNTQYALTVTILDDHTGSNQLIKEFKRSYPNLIVRKRTSDSGKSLTTIYHSFCGKISAD